MNRTDILNALATTLNLKRYLEIGVRNPSDNFDKIVCEERTGVDRRMLCVPDAGRPWEMFNVTSDEFFARYPDRRFELIFIDGNHSAEQVRKDLWNAIKAIGYATRARIVMHDCNPPDEHYTHGSLCGTAYQAFLELRGPPADAMGEIHEYAALDCCCVDCDYGVGIIRLGKPAAPVRFPIHYTYADFAEHRAEWLNLISPEDWKPE